MSKPEYFRKLKKGNRPQGYHIKRFWATMTTAERKAHCLRRAKSLKKTLSKLTPEEHKARLAPCAAGLKKKLSTKEGREEHRKMALKNLEKINNPVEKDLPRVNDYAGPITYSEYASL